METQIQRPWSTRPEGVTWSDTRQFCLAALGQCRGMAVHDPNTNRDAVVCPRVEWNGCDAQNPNGDANGSVVPVVADRAELGL